MKSFTQFLLEAIDARVAAMKSAQRKGVDPKNSHDSQAKAYKKIMADRMRKSIKEAVFVPRERQEVLDENYDPSNKAHTTVKRLMGKYDSADLMSHGVRAHYHKDGSAQITTRNKEAIKTVSQSHLKGDHSHQNKMLSKSTHKVGDLHYSYKNHEAGHSLHIHEETLYESYRHLAVHGIGFERHAVPSKGQYLDYYHPATGDKHEGKIVKKSKDSEKYTVRNMRTGEKHEFHYYHASNANHSHIFRHGKPL